MFPRSIRLFSVQGVDIRVDPSWFLIAALVTWSLAAHYFPRTFPGLQPGPYLLIALAAMLGFFGSLVLHELAHALVARRNAVSTRSITLFLFGGVAELQEDPKSPEAEIKIALAGPAMSLVLAIVFGLISLASPEGVFATVTRYLSIINLVLAIFNLLPAFPLDGGRVLRAFMWRRSGDLLQATATASRAGQTLAYVLIALGVLSLFSGNILGGLWQVMLGFFLMAAARAGYQQEFQKTAFEGVTVGDTMTRNPHVVTPDMTLSEVLQDVVLRDRVSFLPVVEHGVLLGSIDSDLMAGIDRENWDDTRAEDILVGLAAQPRLSPETGLPEVMEIVTQSGQRKFLVTHGHRLAGVLTLADLTRYLGLAQQFADHMPPRHAEPTPLP